MSCFLCVWLLLLRVCVCQVRKDVSSHFGADVMSDVGLHVNKGQAIVVGMGKKNPNAMKGRERRGKAKKGSK